MMWHQKHVCMPAFNKLRRKSSMHMTGGGEGGTDRGIQLHIVRARPHAAQSSHWLDNKDTSLKTAA